MCCLRLGHRSGAVQCKTKHVINANPNTRGNQMEPKDYSQRYYKSMSMSRKRQIIDTIVQELHDQYFDMIERALAHSDMQHAKDVIMHVKAM